jgi:hypothetical protein
VGLARRADRPQFKSLVYFIFFHLFTFLIKTLMKLPTGR